MVYCFGILWPRRSLILFREKWYLCYNAGNQSEQFCRDLAFNLINALAQMHKKGMAHRDLKLANILINDDFQFKISDFGLARVQ